MGTLLTTNSWYSLDEATQKLLIAIGIKLGIFLVFVFLSVIFGKSIPRFLKLLIRRISPQPIFQIYQNIFDPVEKKLGLLATLILLSLCLNFIQEYTGFYRFFKFFSDLSIAISIATLMSGIFKNFLRYYGINMIRKFGFEVDELLLVFETIANVIIGFFVAVAFAQSQNVNLIGLVAGLGIGGIAVAFASQKTLEQIFGTIVIYLDRPYTPGEYIRVNLSSQGILFARVEAIGLRSTKLRTLAKSTLVVVPNSTMASADIENITRGKKVMVLLYLDFPRALEKTEQALLEKVVKESTNTLFGIDPNSTKISIFPYEDGQNKYRARVSFFILGSSENSLEFRKQLLELANDSISKKLESYGIEFIIQEPTLYLESPVPI
ncbi:mechanosensitive ion channel family protein [Aetokthonos hydrillicola Thurmond2011]|jgi:small-conductance mechanosensitive channel|uniref:Mechanosensitive ion channel family protein n=1 Tax=Aetokthonos hydrillicola Thurmond2011 TaxID=2712845 RepID=A0AAP5IFB0_9CYAN|nr:mechanosensitive ion channel domain-containing protein [Aetokthonos hydrillicola]MBO3461939.1 mechanosensitive ion channel [Aetokthonos hydrillicola CCALA 1050]MBW4585396.1 mechanosensitive ion channel family protein [Aetokthonos hydrillicola CCALA 1050]MDR9899097.1 mechanosensitive ion channel family protein [Aetokthonos hydrillicola Thurmond2011]